MTNLEKIIDERTREFKESRDYYQNIIENSLDGIVKVQYEEGKILSAKPDLPEDIQDI